MKYSTMCIFSKKILRNCFDTESFQSRISKKGTPSHNTTENIVSNFEKYGSIASIQKKSKQKREEAKK
jgi:hypothetical protein